jgi:hypothetical protein
MHLDEISLKQEIKAGRTPAKILQKYGWTILGSGLNGTVAQHPKKPYVLKLFTRDQRYQKFIKFVEQNQGNKHLPVINKNLRQIPDTPMYYIRMERLIPISEQDLWTKYQPEMLYLTLLGIKNDIDISNPDEDNIKTILNNLHMGTNILRKVDFSALWAALNKSPRPSWVDISRKLVDFAYANDIDFLDTHNENLMLRGNTLVITDPF